MPMCVFQNGFTIIWELELKVNIVFAFNQSFF
jgi:hypothetical protein